MRKKKSGPAIFIYCVIAITLIISAVCFFLYYSNITHHNAVLWVAIVSFMIMYHLWLRIIMGNVTKLFRIEYTMSWFKERPFEKKLYKLLKVRRWKDKALTYNPELFSVKDCSLAEIANTMAKAETDHWINEIISVSSILFSLLWGKVWIFAITAFVAMIFDAQFILIQRYNRPRIVRIIEKKAKKNIATQRQMSL